MVVPSAAKPKLLIPRRPRRVAAAAVRNFKTALTTREQVALRFIALAIRFGAADLLPDRLWVEYDAGTIPADIEAHLSDVLARRVHVSLHISPARAVRKPVLQLLDEHGTTIAFAKLGVDTFTRGLVRAEADTVSFLANVSSAVLSVPTVLHAGTWHGHELLVQTALRAGPGVQPGRKELQRAMGEVSRVRGVSRSALTDSIYWPRLVDRVRHLQPSEFAAALTRSMWQLETSSGATELEFGSWHGDWAPWNMSVVDGRVNVWDWEKFESDVPIGFDAVHYDIQYAVMTSAPPARAFRESMEHAPALLMPHGVGEDAARLLVWLYAIEIAVRYLEDHEMEAGATPMSQLSTWLKGVLDVAEAGGFAIHPDPHP